MHRARLLAGAILAAALSAALPPLAAASGGEPTPSAAYAPAAVKAAYLVNFIRFTEWPGGAPADGAPYVVGISGNRAMEDELIRFSERQLVLGRRLRVVRIRNASDLDGLHLAYFDSTAAASAENLTWREGVALLRDRPVLTVSDHPDFVSSGGMIGFFREENVLRFAIAPDAVRASGLVLSSRLLALARPPRSGNADPAPRP